MALILSILIPALLLIYYLRSYRENIKRNRIMLGLLAGGVLLFYIGLACSFFDGVYESLFKLGGACMFFTGVALQNIKQS